MLFLVRMGVGRKSAGICLCTFRHCFHTIGSDEIEFAERIHYVTSLDSAGVDCECGGHHGKLDVF